MSTHSTVPPDCCFTCEVNAGLRASPGGTIYQDDDWIADHGVDLLVRGYLVLKPKRHVHELADLMPDEAATLGPVLQKILAAMRRALATERIYVCSFAETVHHLHLHLLPRHADMPGLGPNLLPQLFAGQRWACTPSEAEDAAARVRQALVAGDSPRSLGVRYESADDSRFRVHRACRIALLPPSSCHPCWRNADHPTAQHDPPRIDRPARSPYRPRLMTSFFWYYT